MIRMNRSDDSLRDVVDRGGGVCGAAGDLTDYVSEDADKVPLQTHTLREFEQHLNDLKKENFSLKLRIYFLEERIQQKYEDSSDDVYRTNIELKVEVESLKQELQEKQKLLDKALTTAESLTNHNETDLQRRCEERRQEIHHMQQVLETKIQLLQEEAQLARNEAERVASRSQHPCVSMESVPMETSGDRSSQPVKLLCDADRDRQRIEELNAALCCKERLIREMTEERRVLRDRVQQMEDQLQLLSTSLLQKERDAEFYQEELSRERLRVQQEMESLIAEQQTQLQQYECAAGQCVSELQKAQLQVESLQSKIHESETSNKRMQQKIYEMEAELRSIRQAAQSQERNIQNLTDSVCSKETETQELYHVIEGQNNTLCKLREITLNQLQNTQGSEAAVESGSVLGLESSLFSCQLQLEAGQRVQRRTQRHVEDLTRTCSRLQTDLQDALQHRDTADTHNQDLRKAVQQLRCEMQLKDSQLRDQETHTQTEITHRDTTIRQLQHNLQEKHTLIQEYSELLDVPSDCSRDSLLDRLRIRIRERDGALERSIDEKFRCLEEKESEVRHLQLALREKDRDLQRLHSLLRNNEETITSLDALLRRKEMDLEQLQESCQKLQWLKQESEERHTLTLRERDSMISLLQTALHTHSKETEELRSVLLKQVSLSPADVLEELNARLSVKERQFQDVLSDSSRQTQEHHRQIDHLLDTISTRDQYIKDYGDRLRQIVSERTAELQELRRQLSAHDHEPTEVIRERETQRERELENLQSLLKEKEKFIQELLTSRPKEEAQAGVSDDHLELQAVREELQLAVRKQRESERELSELHSVLTRGQQGVCCTDQQSVLQQLVSEQQKLNEALRTERSIYQNLNHINRQREKSASVIDAELDAVRTLRGQLEEVLLKSREMALALGRAALVQADYGESSTDDEDDEEDDEEDNESSSEEFTDSIEDDEGKLTAKSLTATRSGVFETCEEVQRRETHETEQQLVQAAHSSLSQIRKTSSGRHVENSELNQNRTGSESGSELDCGVRAGDVMAGECGETGERPKARRLPQRDFQMLQEEEEEEYDDDEDGDEREGVCVSQGKRGPPCVKMRERRWKRRCTRPHSLDLGALLSHRPAADDLDLEREIEGDSGGSSSGGGGGAISFWQHVEAGLREQAGRLRGDLAFSRQESRELQERLMVSEATVHAQAEQLKEYRELLSEAAVQRVSKQVQVDLQDLGYETSGRSENEAERDDASSPEFEVEMSTSLSCKDCGRLGDRCWGCRGDCDGGQVDDSSLKALVQDLRAQLTRCHRVIRSLQLRVRSLSTTSDYSSSLERTPRKVNWALQASAAVEEDEGWQSDGPVFDPLRPSRELQDLLTRVTLLETHIKSAKTEGRSGAQEGRSGAEEGRGRAEEGRGRAEEGRSATWPAKYNTLIQAQARELSYLRQKMREGRGICHILTQHLSDTTKAFEELLRANDIDYYMSQSFREQLSQSTALAQRLSSKISGRDGSELQDDKAGHELLALRLRKELQQKDHIIRSLHTKMQQRLDTPSSSHAPSETTDQSDRSSIVSEERVSTNEDVDLCSDVDAASEYTQEEAPPKDRERPSSLPTPPCCQPGIAPCGAQEGNSGFSLPHSLSSYQLTASCLNDSCSYGPVSHHATLQHQTAGRDRVSLMDDGAFWENMIQPIRGTGQSVAPTNIYIQSLDSVTQLNNEIRELKEENMTLQTKIQTSRDSMQEMEQLREAVLSGCGRLKQAELEAEQWKEELRRLQTHSCEQSQQIQQLRQERQSSQEHANRLKHEVSLLQQQLSDSRQLLHSLQCELQLYDRVCGVEKSPPTGFVPEVSCPSVQLGELLVEVRAVRAQLERSVQENGSLRAQLQKQLDQSSELRPSPLIPASPLRDALYRRQILHDPSPSPPVRDVGPFPAGPPYSPYSELEDNSLNANDSLEPQEDLEGEAPDGSFANRNGRHAIGHVDDFSALQQQVLEGRGLVQRMEAELQSCLNTALLEALDYGTVKTLLSNSKTLRQILEEAVSLLKMFWRAALPSSDGPAHFIQREHVMQAEIHSLRLRMAEQEEVLQGTVQRLRSTSRTKENMETFIINQLSRTRDVLKKARANLEKNELRISSFSSSSSSLCHGQIFKGFPSERSQWGGMTHVHPGISTESVFLQPSKK